mmetsp:Transcript_19381/g.30732  ORF Transcript_19381/g.30732 Transcript_19381/m.30732 type:complete len:214 (-) Transcript_19381:662-1303(-)
MTCRKRKHSLLLVIRDIFKIRTFPLLRAFMPPSHGDLFSVTHHNIRRQLISDMHGFCRLLIHVVGNCILPRFQRLLLVIVHILYQPRSRRLFRRCCAINAKYIAWWSWKLEQLYIEHRTDTLIFCTAVVLNECMMNAIRGSTRQRHFSFHCHGLWQLDFNRQRMRKLNLAIFECIRHWRCPQTKLNMTLGTAVNCIAILFHTSDCCRGKIIII